MILLWPGGWCQSQPWPPLSCMSQKVAGVQQPSAPIPPCRRVKCTHTPYPPCSLVRKGLKCTTVLSIVDQGVLLAVHQLKGLALEDLVRAIGCVHSEIHLNLWAALWQHVAPLTSINTGHSASHLKHNFGIILRWNYRYSETSLIHTSDIQSLTFCSRFYWRKLICNNPTVHYCSLSSLALFTNSSKMDVCR